VQAPKPGIYMVNKDVNQGRISIGHWGVERGNPDEFALTVMNDILAGYDKVPVKFTDFGLGQAQQIPLRDPLTLAPMAESGK